MRLVRHTAVYLTARAVAGIAAFAVIAAYTRALTPQEFGELTLAVTGVALLALVAMEGPQMALLRFLPTEPDRAQAGILWGVAVPIVVLCLVAAPASLVLVDDNPRGIVAICALYLAATILHRFQLTTVQARLQPRQYAIIGSAESVLEMAIGIALVQLGYGVIGALTGSVAALLLVVAARARLWWVSWSFFDGGLWRRMIRFALPLSAMALLGWLATFADRWLLLFYRDAPLAGSYAAAYDLPMNLLGVPLMVMLLAGYPLTISAYTASGVDAARVELRRLSGFVVLILFPATVGIVLVGPLLINIFLGEAFRPLALLLLPILSVANFMKSVLWYTNYGYVLALRSDLTLLLMAVTTAVNLALNLVLIPRYGATGSALAALVSFSVGAVASIATLRRVFPMPWPDPALIVSAMAGVCAMTPWLWLFYGATHWTAILYVIPVAVLLYGAAVLLVMQISGRKPLELLREI